MSLLKNTSWMRNVLRKSIFHIISLLGVLILLVVFLQKKRTHYFPDIAEGSYSGTIDGIESLGTSSSTIYVERGSDASKLLLLVFRHGWESQEIDFVYTPGGQDRKILPLTLSDRDSTYKLHGVKGEVGYSGTVVKGESAVGSWSLKPLKRDELNSDISTTSLNFDFPSWRLLKAQVSELSLKDSILSTRLEENRRRHDKLAEYVLEERSLRKRSSLRRAQLSQKVEQLREERKAKRKVVKDSVSKLEQLTRITRRGRAVELARRVAKRENKWYQVNWQQGADVSSLEQSFADRMNLDLRRLKGSLSKVNEYLSLKNKIAEERRRIRALQLEEREKMQEKPEEENPEFEKERRPWWKRLDSVFG